MTQTPGQDPGKIDWDRTHRMNEVVREKPAGLAARAVYSDEQRLADQRGQLTNPLPDDGPFEMNPEVRAAVEAEQERQNREVQQVAEAWPGWVEEEVAVVVFVKARGADAADARDRGRISVSQALLGSDRDRLGVLPAWHLGQVVEGATVEVKGVVELGRAAAGGFVRVSGSERAFR